MQELQQLQESAGGRKRMDRVRSLGRHKHIDKTNTSLIAGGRSFRLIGCTPDQPLEVGLLSKSKRHTYSVKDVSTTSLRAATGKR